MNSPITTHVLDTSRGCPAAGIQVSLYRGDQPDPIGRGETDADGRIMTGLVASDDFQPGIYRLRFETAEYFQRLERSSFYPEVIIAFETEAGQEHYHVPLLLAPFGYSTYRGS
tara:strand:- start:146197 stop:146535 length:339 start_codon:yes stop_codon:yes gene_type:complete